MTNVAIACQGGGSHTAFTAGVLAELVPRVAGSDRELVGISGTSGGAMSAATAWYASLEDGPEAVRRRSSRCGCRSPRGRRPTARSTRASSRSRGPAPAAPRSPR